MSETYSFSTAKPNGFGSALKEDQFKVEIEADPGIAPTVVDVARDGDSVIITFSEALNVGEKTILDGLMAAHVPRKHTTDHMIVAPRYTDSSLSDYLRIASVAFPGATYAKAEIVSYRDAGATSYNVRVFDKTNSTILTTVNFGNTVESSQKIGDLTGISSQPSELEFHAQKVGGGTKDQIHFINIRIDFA